MNWSFRELGELLLGWMDGCFSVDWHKTFKGWNFYRHDDELDTQYD
jgi:hypothetical protein